jgi:LysR family transcriptional regulator, hydrogen peroxide-inducible genes activator
VRTWEETETVEPVSSILAVPASSAIVMPAGVEDLRVRDVVLFQDGHCLRDQALDVCRQAGVSLFCGSRTLYLRTGRRADTSPTALTSTRYTRP